MDTSAWIEFFRKREPCYTLVSDMINGDRVCCIGLVLAELLQGSKSNEELNVFGEFRHVFDFLPESAELWEQAGELSYNLRRKGKKVGLSDCYISVVTNNYNTGILTLDKHFRIIKKVLDINIVNLG